MYLKITPKYVIAFLALLFFMHEAHEIVHTTIGRMLCGCWGERDFNIWGLCNECAAGEPLTLLATFAGPLFTFIMIWIGATLLAPNRTVNEKSLGFSLVFANMPFARIITAAMGGGDEVWALNKLLGNYELAWGIGMATIILIIAYPLYRAYCNIENKWRMAWFLLFFITPVFIDLLVVLGIMNSILEQGIGAHYGILGSPILVNIWTAVVLIILLISKNNLNNLQMKNVSSISNNTKTINVNAKIEQRPGEKGNLKSISLLLVFLFSFLYSTILPAQSDPDDILIGKRKTPEVLLVGTFHFGYPNLDAHKISEENQVDILSVQKQEEVAELVDYIARFRPTKIVVEAGTNTGYLMRRYERWQAGTEELKAEEIDQIAFRLLERYKLDTLYGCDSWGLTYDMQFSPDSTAFENYVGAIFEGYDWQSDDPLDSLYSLWYEHRTELSLKMPLLDYFKYLNSDKAIDRSHVKYPYKQILLSL